MSKLPRFSLLAATAAAALALTACGANPAPATLSPAERERLQALENIDNSQKSWSERLEETGKVNRATSEARAEPIGKPFALGDCVAQAHSVTFTNISPSTVTVITADCPTATTETQHVGGKYPQTNTVVRPKRAP